MPTDPIKKIETLKAEELKNPTDWKIPFSMAQTYKHRLKDCDSAVPAYSRAAEKSAYREVRILTEMGYCLLRLKQNDRVIQSFETHLARTGGALESENARNLLSQAYFRNSQPEKGLLFAKPGSPGWIRASDKTMKLAIKIRLKQALRQLRLQDQTRIRITLPIDRPYQKLLSFGISPERGIEVLKNPVPVGLNRYAEIARKDTWPDEIRLTVVVSQKVASMFEGGRPEIVSVDDPAHPFFAEATFNPNNEYSLNDDEFRRIVTQSYSKESPGDVSLKQSMDYLRSHFKYAKRLVQRKSGALNVWKSGQGDCGFYSFLTMSMLRARGIPVRRLYGINIIRDGTTHVIVEIPDRKTGQWFPHDPIISQYFGFINPMYIPFSTDAHIHGVKTIDGVAHIDTPSFLWIGDRSDRLEFEVTVEGTIVHSSAKPSSSEELEPSETSKISYPDE